MKNKNVKKYSGFWFEEIVHPILLGLSTLFWLCLIGGIIILLGYFSKTIVLILFVLFVSWFFGIILND